MDLSTLRSPVADDARGRRLIVRRLRSDVVLINQIGHYIVDSGGKRLRPLSVLLAARACGYRASATSTWPPSWNSSTPPPCCTTTWWTAPSWARRDTANAVWGNEASVLVGDFLTPAPSR